MPLKVEARRQSASERLEASFVRLAAALCSGDDRLVRECVNRALDAGATVQQLREVIHTSYLFDGYPTALEGFRILGEITGAPKVKPVEFNYTGDSVRQWRERGEKLSRVIYGPQFDTLIERVRKMAPELADAMMVEGYGKVLARPELDPALRELCVVAILAAKNRPRQLLSHSLGAMRLGVKPAWLRALTGLLEGVAPRANLKRASGVIEEAARKYSAP
jgi:alkylhydroperoxidase/carboxymuconolactone decarboxylase family protein YurZ